MTGKKKLLVTVYDITPSDNFENFHLGKLINPRGKRFTYVTFILVEHHSGDAIRPSVSTNNTHWL